MGEKYQDKFKNMEQQEPKEKLDNSETCALDDQCKSGYCTWAFKCANKAKIGEKCTEDDDCVSGLCIFNWSSFGKVCDKPKPGPKPTKKPMTPDYGGRGKLNEMGKKLLDSAKDIGTTEAKDELKDLTTTQIEIKAIMDPESYTKECERCSKFPYMTVKE